MHFTQILYFLSWPVLIYAMYRVVLYFLKKLDKKLAEIEDKLKKHGMNENAAAVVSETTQTDQEPVATQEPETVTGITSPETSPPAEEK